MLSEPQTRYVKRGDAHIAYQVVGDGPVDLVVVRGYISHLEVAWESPALAAFYRRLASFCRLILFDKRGTGLSDRVPEDRLPTLEQRMDDVRAVMDVVGSDRAALLGASEAGPMLRPRIRSARWGCCCGAASPATTGGSASSGATGAATQSTTRSIAAQAGARQRRGHSDVRRCAPCSRRSA